MYCPICPIFPIENEMRVHQTLGSLKFQNACWYWTQCSPNATGEPSSAPYAGAFFV